MASNTTLPVWFDPIEAVISYLFMAASFITIWLYWMEIIFLISLRNSIYKGMFYQIFTVGIMVDVISLVNNYFGCVFPAKGWFTTFYLSMGTFVGQMYLMIAWTARGIQGCTVVALALNRATAVCLPIKHKQIWNSKYISLIHVFQLGVGLCIGSGLITQKFYWKYERDGFYVQFENKEFRRRFFMAAYLIETMFVALIIVINLTMVIAFRTKYRMRMTAAQTQLNQKVMNEKQRQEYNLTIVAGLTCVAEIIYYLYVIYVFGINTSVPTRVFYLLYDIINDIYCGLSGWLLLIYSRSMRAHVTKMMRCPMFGFRRMRIMIPPEQHFSSATNLDNKNTSTRRVPTCGTPC